MSHKGTVVSIGSSSVQEPVTLISDVNQRKQRRQHNDPNNSYKAKKNFTSFYTEANPCDCSKASVFFNKHHLVYHLLTSCLAFDIW